MNSEHPETTFSNAADAAAHLAQEPNAAIEVRDKIIADLRAELEKASEEIKLLQGSVDFGVKCNDDLQEQLEKAQRERGGLRYSMWEQEKRFAGQHAEVLAQLGEIQIERNNLKQQLAASESSRKELVEALESAIEVRYDWRIQAKQALANAKLKGE